MQSGFPHRFTLVTDHHQSRSRIIGAIFIIVTLVFILRLLYLQIIDTTYKKLAQSNAIRKLTIYPSRGLIYDRKGKLIVFNEAIYDLMAIPSGVKSFDTALFCKLLEVDFETVRENLKAARKYSRYKPSVLLKQIPAEIYGRFQENLFQFPGFYGQVRTIRKYPDKAAAHILGYIGEASPKQIEKDAYYQLSDYIGISGIEQSYEKELRGQKGIKYVLVDVHNREQGSFLNGVFDSAAAIGKNLTVSLSMDLQLYGEKLMQNKRGSIVAIEPATGEILAMVSSPGYDPNLLSGRERGNNYKILSEDSLIPLFNKPIMAQYPPGSTYKVMNAIGGLRENVINPNTAIACGGAFRFGGIEVKCSHRHPNASNVKEAIQYSCNSYFCWVFKKIIDDDKFNSSAKSLENWRAINLSFGLGKRLGIDVPNELDGLIPSAKRYNKTYGENSWKSLTIISLGIGQGEILVTPLQLANMYATIANRGFYFTPHIAKKFEGDTTVLEKFERKNLAMVDSSILNLVVDGLEDVVTSGTARIAQLDEVTICGKTGTAENYSVINGKRVQLRDHSLFAAFAPKENPKIAVAVIVENSGFGATYAAPIASLMIEKYLNDTIAEKRKLIEQRMVETNLLELVVQPKKK